MPSTAQEFQNRFGEITLPHSRQLFDGIQLGICTLTSAPAIQDTNITCRNLLSIWQHRAKHLERFTSKHAKNIWRDAIHLCEALARDPDKECLIWGFSETPYYNYSVFTSATNNEVFSCILAVDKRIADPNTGASLWGNDLGKADEASI